MLQFFAVVDVTVVAVVVVVVDVTVFAVVRTDS